MRRLAWMVVMLVPLVDAGTAQAQQQTKTQNFDSAGSAAGGGWRALNNNINQFNFGFSPTSNAQGTSGPGEGGGVIARSEPTGFYADTVLSGTARVDQVDLEASGRLKWEDTNFDGEWYFGWINTASAEANERQYLGIQILEQRAQGWRVLAGLNDFGTPPAEAPLLFIPDNTVLDFQLSWDADGGAAAGEGKLSLTLTTLDGSETFVSELEGMPDPADLSVDAFGLLTNSQATRNDVANFWFDDLTYSAFGQVAAEGDADGNGVVDLGDFQLILGNLFQSVPISANGDVTGDGFVNFDDFRVWKNVHSGGGTGAAAIPEPAAAGLLCLGATLAMAARRRRTIRV